MRGSAIGVGRKGDTNCCWEPLYCCAAAQIDAAKVKKRGEARRGNVFGLCLEQQHAGCGVGVAVSRGQTGRVDEEMGRLRTLEELVPSCVSRLGRWQPAKDPDSTLAEASTVLLDWPGQHFIYDPCRPVPLTCSLLLGVRHLLLEIGSLYSGPPLRTG